MLIKLLLILVVSTNHGGLEVGTEIVVTKGYFYTFEQCEETRTLVDYRTPPGFYFVRTECSV